MKPANLELRHMMWILIVAPVVAFAAYVSWLVVPEVVRIVVPAVVRAVTGA